MQRSDKKPTGQQGTQTTTQKKDRYSSDSPNSGKNSRENPYSENRKSRENQSYDTRHEQGESGRQERDYDETRERSYRTDKNEDYAGQQVSEKSNFEKQGSQNQQNSQYRSKGGSQGTSQKSNFEKEGYSQNKNTEYSDSKQYAGSQSQRTYESFEDIQSAVRRNERSVLCKFEKNSSKAAEITDCLRKAGYQEDNSKKQSDPNCQMWVKK